MFTTLGKIGLGLAITGSVVNTALYNGKFVCMNTITSTCNIEAVWYLCLLPGIVMSFSVREFIGVKRDSSDICNVLFFIDCQLCVGDSVQ